MSVVHATGTSVRPTGSGAAAILAAGIGSLALAVVAIAADRVTALRTALIFYRPTGPLSGVTTTAVVLWLLVWFVLDRRWRAVNVRLGRVTVAAFILLALSVLLTFPPLADMF